MPEKDPNNWSMGTWALLLCISMLGGFTSWYKRVKEGHTRTFNMIELIGEAATSGLMGFVGFSSALWYFDSVAIASAVAGMSAHFATRLLFRAEGLLDLGAKKLAGKIK